MASARETGLEAEHLALAHLQRHGLVLERRNFRCRMGEIDLIMRDGETLVFVEVRLRARGSYASAAESIDARKRHRIVTAARVYLSGRAERPCRFDCILLDRVAPDAVTWIKSAFDA
jgi:putative endonuclease